MLSFVKEKSIDTQVVEQFGQDDYNDRLEMLRQAFDGLSVEIERELMGVTVKSRYLFEGITFDTLITQIVMRGQKNEYNNNVLKASDKKDNESQAEFDARYQQRVEELKAQTAAGGFEYSVENDLSRNIGPRKTKPKEDEFTRQMRVVKYLVGKKKAGTITEEELRQLREIQEEMGLV